MSKSVRILYDNTIDNQSMVQPRSGGFAMGN